MRRSWVQTPPRFKRRSLARGESKISFKGVITKGDLVYWQYCLLLAPKYIIYNRIIILTYFILQNYHFGLLKARLSELRIQRENFGSSFVYFWHPNILYIIELSFNILHIIELSFRVVESPTQQRTQDSEKEFWFHFFNYSVCYQFIPVFLLF